jgi:peptidyl-prolyl cis-trans isomerase A (cyclophilin A)
MSIFLRGLALVVFFQLGANCALAVEADKDNAVTTPAQPVTVVFNTTLGAFSVELDAAKAPITVANFVRYVDEGFYNNTLFHRVIPGFMIQGGGYNSAMKAKNTYPPIDNESRNGLKNIRGSIAMARKRDPKSATAQFFINVAQNPTLNGGRQDGYTVFGQVVQGMEIVDKIVAVPTAAVGQFKDVPQEEVVILSARRQVPTSAQGGGATEPVFVAGVHYIVLDAPLPTGESDKIEVVEAFSYGCLHCFAFEALLKPWADEQVEAIDFWQFPASWNAPMEIYARAYYAAQQLGVADDIHPPLFDALLIQQLALTNAEQLGSWMMPYGVDKQAFIDAYNSPAVDEKVAESELLGKAYQLGSVPQLVVNGKYRVDAMRAGGQAQMLAVVDFLVAKEQAAKDGGRQVSLGAVSRPDKI